MAQSSLFHNRIMELTLGDESRLHTTIVDLLDDKVKPIRQKTKGSFVVDTIPYTPPKLICEIFDKIPPIKNRCLDTKIAVIYTIEMAIYLSGLGFSDITLITREQDDKMEKGATKFGYTYVLEQDVKNMKFDVVIGNPPYSIPIDANGRTAGTKKRLYATFFDTIFNKASCYGIVLPSNWIGRHSDQVRQTVMNDPNVKWIYDVSHYFNSTIKGTPTCVVIKDATYHNTMKYTYGSSGVIQIDATRLVSFNIANFEAILSKIPTLQNMGSMWCRNVNSGVTRSCGFLTDSKTDFPVVLITGNKNEPPETSWLTTHVNQKHINKYKVITNCNASRDSIGNIKIVDPGFYTTDSIVFFPVDDQCTADNIKQYLESNIVRFIVKVVRTSHGNSQTFFRNVPLVDFSKCWTDQELYEHFNLTHEEILLIEGTIK